MAAWPSSGQAGCTLAGGGSATFLGPVPAASTPPAFVEQLEHESYCLPVKCDFWKTCIFVS